ncbi:ankyrin repeat domain-containing protein [Litoreibacter roseus]|uniref:Pyrrolo-quinoline quinone repeat domain-containing protein n=1 Tax=Litoreibacter roseus TaxID=2601869 RepID=A0A6N6JC61_9RHOB|nr:ankyrin repeat domain-containing protein [Litoreibacter roseus]GFE63736.1 hypothetical protein KIN_08100 [Litoreibacter roseus]
MFRLSILAAACIVSAGVANAQDCADLAGFRSILRMDVGQVDQCLALGADPNALTGRDDEALIHRAAGHPDPAVMAAVVAAGGDPNRVDGAGNTPIHWAASRNQNPEMIARLVAVGADPNRRRKDKSDMTTLNMALFNPNPAVITALLNAGADPLQKGQYDRLALHWAAMMDAPSSVLETLVAATGDVDARDGMLESTALHFAAQRAKKAQTVQTLLALGADIQAQDWRGNSPLHRVVQKNEITDILLALLSSGADPNAKGYGGATPLHHAARYSDVPQFAALLVEAGADLRALMGTGHTPLHRAAEYGDSVAMVQMLLDLGADPDAVNTAGSKPLWKAARNNDTVGIVRLLREVTTDPDGTDGSGVTALEVAASGKNSAEVIALLSQTVEGLPPFALHRALGVENHKPQVIQLLLAKGADPNERDKNGDTAMHKALAFDMHPDVFDMLIAAGANLSRHGRYGRTVLHQATLRRANLQYIRPMIEAGSALEARNDRRATPLHEAAYYDGTGKGVATFLSLGADPNAVDQTGRTPLQRAFKSDYGRDAVSAALIPETDLSVQDEDGNTALHLALLSEVHREMVPAVLAAGADVNRPNNAGLTPFGVALIRAPQFVPAFLAAGADVTAVAGYGELPLHLAVGRRSAEAVKALLDAGAAPDHVNGLGQTVLHLLSGGDRDLAAVILAAGADPNRTDDAGQTPLHSAVANVAPDVVDLLLEAGADVNAVNGQGQTPLLMAMYYGLGDPIVQTLLDAGGGPVEAVRSDMSELDLYDFDEILSVPVENRRHEFGGAAAFRRGEFLVTRIARRGNARDPHIEGGGYLYDAASSDLLQVFENPAPAMHRRFGAGAALAGPFALIASPEQWRADGGPVFGPGAVHVFSTETGAALHRLENPMPAQDSLFAVSVAASDNLAAVGAPGNQARGVNTPTSGFVHLFDVETGALIRSIAPPLDTLPRRFGTSLALDGGRLLVGSPEAFGEEAMEGQVYLFDAQTGALLLQIENPDRDAFQWFGQNVALDQGRILVSASAQYGVNWAVDAVFAFDAETGQMLHRVPNPRPDIFDFGYGASLELEGDIAVIGAPHSLQEGTGPQLGAVFVYDLRRGELVQTVEDPQGDPSIVFGSGLALSEEWLLVTSEFRAKDDPQAPDGDHAIATIFKRSDIGLDVFYPQGLKLHETPLAMNDTHLFVLRAAIVTTEKSHQIDVSLVSIPSDESAAEMRWPIARHEIEIGAEPFRAFLRQGFDLPFFVLEEATALLVGDAPEANPFEVVETAGGEFVLAGPFALPQTLGLRVTGSDTGRIVLEHDADSAVYVAEIDRLPTEMGQIERDTCRIERIMPEVWNDGYVLTLTCDAGGVRRAASLVLVALRQ